MVPTISSMVGKVVPNCLSSQQRRNLESSLASSASNKGPLLCRVARTCDTNKHTPQTYLSLDESFLYSLRFLMISAFSLPTACQWLRHPSFESLICIISMASAQMVLQSSSSTTRRKNTPCERGGVDSQVVRVSCWNPELVSLIGV